VRPRGTPGPRSRQVPGASDVERGAGRDRHAAPERGLTAAGARAQRRAAADLRLRSGAGVGGGTEPVGDVALRGQRGCAATSDRGDVRRAGGEADDAAARPGRGAGIRRQGGAELLDGAEAGVVRGDQRSRGGVGDEDLPGDGYGREGMGEGDSLVRLSASPGGRRAARGAGGLRGAAGVGVGGDAARADGGGAGEGAPRDHAPVPDPGGGSGSGCR